jgi:hypothetical protein
MKDHPLQLDGTLLASHLAADSIRLKLEEIVNQSDRVLNPPSPYARWSLIGFGLFASKRASQNRVYFIWQVAELLCDLLKKENGRREIVNQQEKS